METTTNIQHEPKFDTRNQHLLYIWDEIQRVQTDFCFAQELSAYYMSEYWINTARSVLDVGTGNGYFLSRLLERFPDRDYTGIDISKELIDLATSNLKNTSVRILAQDYFAVTDVYDFVIMRLFWHHLPQDRITEALDKLVKITKPGSSVLVSDAFDEVRRFVPDLPEFRRVITMYTHQQRAVGRNRDIVGTLLEWGQTVDSWQVASDIRLILPSSIPGYLQLYRRIYELWIELFECLRELDIDFSPAKEELSQWCKNPHAFTQAGLRVIRLDRLA
jgi:SAM-dependent methyltransferase